MKKYAVNYSLFFVTIILFPVFFSGCALTTKLLSEHYTQPQVLPAEVLYPQEIVWNKISTGIEETGFIIEDEQIKWECVKIDLHNPNIKLHASPTKNQLHQRFIIKNYAIQTNSTIAINTVPFDLDGRTFIPVSIVKIDGQIICPANNRYSALVFTQNNDGFWKAKVIKNQTDKEIESAEYAFGGFYTILYNQEIYEFEKYKRSRTAAGTSHNGRFLYLFAACGINCPTGRNGLNFEECGIILQQLGCTEALEFDGGHSTGLVLNKKNLLKPDLQRTVPAILGIEITQN